MSEYHPINVAFINELKGERTIAQISGVKFLSKSTLEKALKSGYASKKTIDALANFLGCSPYKIKMLDGPGSEQRELKRGEKSFLERISGSWHIYHYTLLSKAGTPILTHAFLSILKDGTCVCFYPDQGIRLAGSARYEDSSRFLVILDSTSGYKEQRIIRGHENVGAREHHGAWLGVDYADRTCTSDVLFSRDEISPASAGQKISKLKSYLIHDGSLMNNSGGSALQDQWNSRLVFGALENIDSGSSISIMTTCFPPADLRSFINAVWKLHQRLAKVTAARPKIRVLLQHYSQTKISELRRKLFGTNFNFRDTALTQAEILFSLQSKTATTIDLEIHHYSCWPWGHYVCIDSSALYFCPLLADDVATTAPMLSSIDSGSAVWNKFQQNWELTWADSRPYSRKEVSDEMHKHNIPKYVSLPWGTDTSCR